MRRSLELACSKEKEEIGRGLSCNRILADACPYLQHLHLLHDALHLDEIKKHYFGALEEIMTHAEQRRDMVLEALANQSFSQVTVIYGYISLLVVTDHHLLVLKPARATPCCRRKASSPFSTATSAVWHGTWTSLAATGILLCSRRSA